MPIYEYRCSSCGHELEALQKFSDAPLVTCPSCQAAALVKQVSAAGFQLKGSGWYATDFKGGGAKPALAKDDVGAAPESGSGKDSASTGDSKNDATTAAKGEGKAEAKGEAKDTKSKAAPPAAKTGSTPAAT